MKIITFIYDDPVGTIESLAFVEPLRSPDFSGQKLHIDRIILNRDKIKDLFPKEYVHVTAQRIPFQITIEDSNGLNIKLHNVWITAFAMQYMTDEFVIIEDMDCIAESLSSLVIK